MLAELRPDPFRRAGCGAQLRHDAWQIERFAVRQLRAFNHAASVVVRIFVDVGGRVDSAARNIGFLQHAKHMFEVVLRSPLGDRFVEHVVVLNAPVVSRELRVFGQVRASHRTHQALEDAIAVAGNDDVAPILARIRVGGRDAGETCAGAFPYVTEGRKLRDQAFHHAEHRLVERDVDVLALAAVRFQMVHGEQRADDAIK